MAGHSHWAQVKHKKTQVDKKKGQLIGKIVNAILVSARENPNPDTNPKLRAAIERAKEAGVSAEVIERNIKKAVGLSSDRNLEEFIVEGYGPSSVALIIKVITDNRNRSLNEIKNIFNKFKAKIAEPGSVSWMFKELGVITIEKKDFNEKLIDDLGNLLTDFKEKENIVELYFQIKDLYEGEKTLRSKSINILSTKISFIPNNYVNINSEEREKVLKFIDELLELTDVDKVFSNL